MQTVRSHDNSSKPRWHSKSMPHTPMSKGPLWRMLSVRLHPSTPGEGYMSYDEELEQKAQLLHPFLSQEDVASGAWHQRAQQIAEELRELANAQRRPWYMVSPNSLFRQLWDTCAILAINFLVVAIPVQIAYIDQSSQCEYFSTSFNPDPNLPNQTGHGLGAAWMGILSIINAFFIADVLLNFVTGVYTSSGEERLTYHLPTIARHYARTYLVFDVLACIPLECVMIAANPDLQYYNLGKLIRLLRLVGMRRRRHGSPLRWLDHVSEIRKEFSYNLRRLVSFVLLLLLTANGFACLIWLAVRVQGFPANTWPVQLGLVDAPVAEEWLFSFFAVISSMVGLGYGSYPPITWPEALVWVFTMLTLCIMFAVLAGLVFAIILANTTGRQQYKDLMDLAVEVLHERGVPPEVRSQVLDFLSAKYPHRRVIHEERVLNELPHAIRRQVAMLSAGQFLRSIPVLARHPDLMLETALLLRRGAAVEEQVLVEQGHALHSVTFIQKGYVDLRIDGQLVDTLGPGMCLGELALLPPPPDPKQLSERQASYMAGNEWRSTFTATALSNCDLYFLRAREFQLLLRQFPQAQQELQEATRRFLDTIERHGTNASQPSSPLVDGGHHNPPAGPGPGAGPGADAPLFFRLGSLRPTHSDAGEAPRRRWRATYSAEIPDDAAGRGVRQVQRMFSSPGRIDSQEMQLEPVPEQSGLATILEQRSIALHAQSPSLEQRAEEGMSNGVMVGQQATASARSWLNHPST